MKYFGLGWEFLIVLHVHQTEVDFSLTITTVKAVVLLC